MRSCDDSVDYIFANEAALKCLSSERYEEAQAIFRQNKQLYPCALTLNNLGYFYYTEGLITKNDRWQKANKLGLRYMKKAAQMEPHPQVLFNIGAALYAEALYTDDTFAEAYHYFEAAQESAYRDLCICNMGVCAFQSAHWQEAAALFGRALGHDAAILAAGGAVPAVPYAYALYESGQAAAFDPSRLLCDDRIDLFDRFVITYVYQKYEAALETAESMLREWYASESVIAMIADCIRYTHAPEKQRASLQALCDPCNPGVLSKLLAQEEPFIPVEPLYIPPLAVIFGYLRTS